MRALMSSLVLLSLGVFSGTAQADSFGFSIGGGGHHHHGHGCNPGWSVGYGSWFAPPPPVVYYAPPPVIRERVYVQPPVIQERILVQPAQPSYETQGYAPRNSALPTPPNRDTVASPVVVRNAAGKNVPVAFVVDNREEELQEGQSRSFSGSGARVIEFDRGGDRGSARYELTGGVYSFTVTSNGWDLVRESGVPQTAKRPLLRKNEIPLR